MEAGQISWASGARARRFDSTLFGLADASSLIDELLVETEPLTRLLGALDSLQHPTTDANGAAVQS